MADIDWDDVLAVASDLTTAGGVPVAAQTMILAYVNESVYEAGFDAGAYVLARCYLAAHLASLTRTKGVEVISQSAGGIARSFASGAGLQTSGWGRAFVALARASACRGPLVP